MSASVEQTADAQTWFLVEHEVTQLLIDAGGFVVRAWTLAAALDVRLGVPFRFVEPDGRALRVDSEEPVHLAPVLGLLGRAVHVVRLDRSGALTVLFGDGSELHVEPHARRVAWEARGSGEFEALNYACRPGGGAPWA